MNNNELPAEAGADSSTEAQVTPLSQTIANALVGSSTNDFGKLKSFKVSTINDRYDITETIIADCFTTAAEIFAKYYHGYKRGLFHNDVFVNVENDGKVLKFKLMAEIKVNYWAEKV